MNILKYIMPSVLFVFNITIAQVDFASKRIINDVLLYQDSKIKSIFYYAPYGLQLVKNNEGKPDFKFIQMRYTGTRLSEDQGAFSFKSLLRFKVANHIPTKKQRDSIKKIIKNKGMLISKLKPLPIHNLKATLIHTAENDTVAKEYGNGFFEGTEKVAVNTYWTERDFTLRLNNEDAQIFWTTFQKDQPTLSVNYTFSSKGLNSLENELSVSGSEEFTETMKARFQQEKDSINTILNEKIIVSGALSINVDTEKWPDLIRQIDINERIPAEYAALDVYCFDFNNDIRKDLSAKRVEIKATGVGSGKLKFKVTFRSTEPDIYAKTIKFIYAVKLNHPYSYRITEIFKDGRLERSAWEGVENWHQLLDITSKPESN
jgi:hypothetical protein